MPISFIQVKEASNPSTTQVSTSINVTAGDVLVVAGVIQGNQQAPPVISDTLGTNFNIIESLYQPGPGYQDPFPNTTGDPQFAANWPLSFGVGLIQQSGLDIVTARQTHQSQLFIANNPMYVLAAEYSGVFITGSDVLIDQKDGRQVPSFGPFTETLNLQPGSLMVCVAAMLNSDFTGPGTGSLRINDFTQPLTRFIYLDSTNGIISANEGSSSFPWYIASFGLAAAPFIIPPPPLPAAIWPDRVTTQVSKSDRIYPYSSFSVTPTALTPIPFVCPHCRVGSQAMIYRDIRDYSVAVGIPDVRHGGIQKGASFDFIYCGSCSYWYRKNDYKRVRNINIVDFGINPNLDPGGNATTAFLNEPETYEAQSNIADDSTRTTSDISLNGFVDAFERLGFQVIPVATGSLDLI